MNKVRDVVLTVSDKFFFVLEILARVILSFLLLLVTVQVFGRNLIGKSFFWSDEVISFLMIWLTFTSLASSTSKGLQIRISFIVDKMPKPIRAILEFLTNIMMLLLGVVILLYSMKLVQSTGNSSLPATHFPTSIQYICLPVSGIGLIVYYGLKLLGLKKDKENDNIEQEEENEHVAD